MQDEIDDELIMPERTEADDNFVVHAKHFLSRLLHRKKRQEETKQEIPAIVPPNPQQNIPKIKHNVSELDAAKKQLEGITAPPVQQKPAVKPTEQVPAKGEKYVKAKNILTDYKKKRG